MPKTAIKIGPKDHGQRMSLAEFDHAIPEEGHLFELARGEIVVTDVPGKPHMRQLIAVRRQLERYDLQNAGKIYAILGGSDCKMLIGDLESERHADVSIYLNAPPEVDDYWGIWIPDLVIEIVSRSGEQRDYVEKREEYLQFGVREYWIIDEGKKQMLALRREGNQWAEQFVKPAARYSTPLLPGLEFDLDAVFK